MTMVSIHFMNKITLHTYMYMEMFNNLSLENMHEPLKLRHVDTLSSNDHMSVQREDSMIFEYYK